MEHIKLISGHAENRRHTQTHKRDTIQMCVHMSEVILQASDRETFECLDQTWTQFSKKEKEGSQKTLTLVKEICIGEFLTSHKRGWTQHFSGSRLPWLTY